MTDDSGDTHTGRSGPQIRVVDVNPPFPAAPSASADLLLRGPAAAMSRVRPGERPQWFNAGLPRDRVDALRALAAELRVGVDAVAALAIEWRLLDEDLGTVRLRALSDSALDRDGAVTVIAPTVELRRWSEQILAGAPFTHGDEMPELAVPARLLARWRPAAGALQDALATLDVDRGRRVDSAAAARGFTLTELVYRHGAPLER